MPRLRISFPDDRVLFAHDLDVRIGDLNYAKHLGHDTLVSLLHEARARFFRRFGLQEWDSDGAALVVADLAVVYLAEVRFGQVLQVEVAADDVARSSCDLVYRVSDRETGEQVALARTRIVFTDRATRKVVGLPPSFLAVLGDQRPGRASDPAC